MLFLRLAIPAATASAATGPCFSWNSTSLEKYGLLSIKTTLVPPPPPSADEQFVQIAAASEVANPSEAMFLAPSVIVGNWVK
jgi:hypothetical protein